jgi:hypothetical protein
MRIWTPGARTCTFRKEIESSSPVLGFLFDLLFLLCGFKTKVVFGDFSRFSDRHTMHVMRQASVPIVKTAYQSTNQTRSKDPVRRLLVLSFRTQTNGTEAHVRLSILTSSTNEVDRYMFKVSHGLT